MVTGVKKKRWFKYEKNGLKFKKKCKACRGQRRETLRHAATELDHALYGRL